MRINKFIAQATGLSRRAADNAISEGRVRINQQVAGLGGTVSDSDHIMLDDQPISAPVQTTTIMFNKPFGYVCSREGQGSQTIYELLPAELHRLKPVGRLDKDSSGLLLLTDNGDLANELTHPRYHKEKVYEVKLDKSLTPADQASLHRAINLEDGPSHLRVTQFPNQDVPTCEVRLSEGRNRQIRRTFAALGYAVTKLHRTQFGPYSLDKLPSGQWQKITINQSV
jgi:23S rRNA pseudouridine2605 synthase